MWGGWGARSADRDTKLYRDGYPGKRDDPSLTRNLEFYKGEVAMNASKASGSSKWWSSSSGDRKEETIDFVLKNWFGDYRKLESRHDYIQWLFPLRETSAFNWDSQELQLHEAQAIQADADAQNRVLRAFQLMLDFYGMQIVDMNTGEIGRAPSSLTQYQNLNHSGHNYLRITRILKSLGELGLERYKGPWCRRFLLDIEAGYLPNTMDSCLNYWLPVIRNNEERAALEKLGEEMVKRLKANGIPRNPPPPYAKPDGGSAAAAAAPLAAGAAAAGGEAEESPPPAAGAGGAEPQPEPQQLTEEEDGEGEPMD